MTPMAVRRFEPTLTRAWSHLRYTDSIRPVSIPAQDVVLEEHGTLKVTATAN